MSPIPVHIKHAGKLFDINLDQDLPPNAFKEAIYLLTAVPVDRMKVMVKGGVLKVSSFFISNFILYSYTFIGRHSLEESCSKTRSDLHGHRCCWRTPKTTCKTDPIPRRFVAFVSYLIIEYNHPKDMDDSELAEAVIFKMFSTIHI